jgi:hypothetical protein
MDDLKIQFSYSRRQYVVTAAMAASIGNFRNKTMPAIVFFGAFIVVYAPGKDLVQGSLEVLGLMTVLTAAFCLFIVSKVNSLMGQRPGFLGPWTVSAERDGLKWTGGETSRFLEWNTLERPVTAFQNVFIFRKTLCDFIPGHAFRDRAECETWKALLNQNITGK